MAAESVSDSELLERVKTNDAYFKWLIDFIPPESYGFSEDVLELVRSHKHRMVESKLNVVQRRRLELNKKKKQQLARLDPMQLHTVSQVQAFVKHHEAGKRCEFCTPVSETGANGAITQSAKSNGAVGAPMAPGLSANAPSREELLERLKERLETLRKERRSSAMRAMPVEAAALYAEQHRVARRLSKAKMRERRREEKKKTKTREKTDAKPEVKAERVSHAKEGEPSKKKARINGPIWKADATSREDRKAKVENDEERKPIVNADGKLVFSKFDFVVSGEPRAAKSMPQRKKRGKHDVRLTGKDYGTLLKKVEARDERIRELETVDAGKANALKERIRWDTAVQRAEGQKVKDDPALLKKNLKRRQEKKAHSAKKWEKRTEAVTQRKEQRQQKRTKNIEARKQSKKDKRKTRR